jgi:CheY-like chemotaxis protein
VSAENRTVVCADADDDERAATADRLAAAGFDVRPAASVGAFEGVLSADVDCVVTGAEFDDGDWASVLELVRSRTPDCPVVLFAATVPDLSRRDGEAVVDYLPRTTAAARDRLVDLVTEAAAGGYQVAYPVPDDERARLEALDRYDVDGSPVQETFERISTLVATHFDAAVAFVGLVDEHEERFVACEGADWETMHREDTVCTHTILRDEVTVIEDVREDPRFAANDRLEAMDVRSYAGARITTPGGHAVGALCCVDDEPRSYTATERRDLRLFAEEASVQFEIRRQLEDRNDPPPAPARGSGGPATDADTGAGEDGGENR